MALPTRIIGMRKTAGGAPSKPLTPLQSILGNVAMFIIAAGVAYMLVSGIKGLTSGGRASGYSLTTTRQVEAGETLSSQNTIWRPVTGRAPVGGVMGKSLKDPIEGYVAIARIGEGKPVKAALVARETGAATRTSTALSGFILTAADIADSARYLKPGDHIDIVAIVTPDEAQLGSLAPRPAVSTVLTNAEVTSVTAGMRVGRNATSASAVIAVTDEQARLLSLLRRFATLEVVLSPRRLDGSETGLPTTVWQGVDDLGLPGKSQPAGLVEPLSAAAAAPAEPEAPAPAAPEPTISIVTPTGVTHAAIPN